MAKYYVQSGTCQFVVNAQDAEGAALWAVDQVICRHFPGNASDMVCVPRHRLQPLIGSNDFLAHVTQVSEIGWGRGDAGEFDTAGLCDLWCQLSTAMHHLLDQLR